MRNFIIVLIASFGLFSCEFQDIDFEGIENYKMEKFENNQVFVTLHVKIKNENWFKLKIKPSQLNVTIEGKDIGILYLDNKVKLKGQKSDVYNAKMHFKIADGALLSLMSLINKDEVKLTFEGKVKGGVFIFSKKIDVKETKSIKPKDLNLKAFG